MIDEKTTNKNYPLPNPENRASEDVGRIATALSMIDADLSACDEKISESSGLAQKLADDALRIPVELKCFVQFSLYQHKGKTCLVTRK